MKVCIICGAQQNDTTIFCSQCNEKLGDPISEKEQKLIEKQTEQALAKSYKKSNRIYNFKLSNIIFLLSLLPYVFIILYAVYSAIFGIYFSLLSGTGSTIYGISAFIWTLAIETFRLFYYPVIPVCFIYQTIYLIIKYGGKKL